MVLCQCGTLAVLYLNTGEVEWEWLSDLNPIK